jgi:hypothetical protein
MIPRALYRLADALELTLEWDGERVRGKRSRRLDLAGVPVTVALEVVASRFFADDAALVLRSTGELGLLIGSCEAAGSGSSSPGSGTGLSGRLRLSLLHLGRLGESPEALLERECPSSLAALEALLAAAVVASFSFQAGDWQPHGT